MGKTGLLLLVMLLTVAAAEQNTVSMDFQGVDLEIFLQWFGNFTNHKIIYSSQRGFGQKKIYFIAPQPVPEQSVEKICMSLLESNGLTLIKVGEGSSQVYKLVESAHAASKPIALYSNDQLKTIESGDYFISQLVLVKHLKAANVLNSIRQAKLLDPQAGSIVEINGANALIINDFVPNVKRVVKIVEMIDQPPPKIEIAFVELKYARATEISQKLQQLFQYKAKDQMQYNVQGVQLTIIPDDRTNSLSIRGTSEEIAEVKELLRSFDQEIKGSEVVARVYRMQNVTADKILPTLKEFIATPLFKEKAQVPGQSQRNESNISIIANEYSKTLLITAPSSAHRLLGDVIKQLDVRRPQVLLETVICEFSPSDVLNIGIELAGLDSIGQANDGTHLHGLSSFGLSSLVDSEGQTITDQSNKLPRRS